MQLGVHIGYWGLGLNSEDQLEIVKAAESAGYDSVWTAEAYGSDAATVLAWLAGQTTRIKLGAGVFQIPGRSPAMTAMTAVTIDHLSDGRMLIGLGASGPQVSEGWHGVRFAHQLGRTREYVAIMRKALSRERLEFQGEHFELPLPDGPGKALKLTIPPIQDEIPIYLAAIGPKNTALAGEIADGWIPTLLSPEFLPELRKNLEEGAARAGRSLDDFDIAPTAQVFITDDVDAARDLTRPFVGLYVGGMGSKKQNFYNQLMRRYGFEEDAEKVQNLYLEGKKEEAMAALPDAFLDQVALIGPPDVVRDRLSVYRDAGVGTLGITPLAFDRAGRIEQLQKFADVFEEIA
jgi:F420-dependent oxidoreductase-like protein